MVDLAERSGLVSIELKKEKAGYVLNSLLVPLLNAAAGLVLEGIADPETVDKTWRIGTGAPVGPFQIYDVVGLTTAYNIASANPDKGSQAWAAYLKTNFIDQGKLGVATGEGFYLCPRRFQTIARSSMLGGSEQASCARSGSFWTGGITIHCGRASPASTQWSGTTTVSPSD